MADRGPATPSCIPAFMTVCASHPQTLRMITTTSVIHGLLRSFHPLPPFFASVTFRSTLARFPFLASTRFPFNRNLFILNLFRYYRISSGEQRAHLLPIMSARTWVEKSRNPQITPLQFARGIRMRIPPPNHPWYENKSVSLFVLLNSHNDTLPSSRPAAIL